MDKEEGIASRCEPEGSRDNGKMITSLLLLVSVLTLARFPAFDDLCTDIIRAENFRKRSQLLNLSIQWTDL